MPRAKLSLRGERVGIFAMDPGRTTGLAVGTPTLRGSTQEIFDRDPLEVFQIDCNDQTVHPTLAEREGSAEIAREYLAITAEWVIDGVEPSKIFFVYEDFILNRQDPSYDREGISPVRVTSLVMGLLYKYNVMWVPQQPSDAKSRWTNDRLRRANLWTPRLEHGRDATKHAALWVVKQMAL